MIFQSPISGFKLPSLTATQYQVQEKHRFGRLNAEEQATFSDKYAVTSSESAFRAKYLTAIPVRRLRNKEQFYEDLEKLPPDVKINVVPLLLKKASHGSGRSHMQRFYDAVVAAAEDGVLNGKLGYLHQRSEKLLRLLELIPSKPPSGLNAWLIERVY